MPISYFEMSRKLRQNPIYLNNAEIIIDCMRSLTVDSQEAKERFRIIKDLDTATESSYFLKLMNDANNLIQQNKPCEINKKNAATAAFYKIKDQVEKELTFTKSQLGALYANTESTYVLQNKDEVAKEQLELPDAGHLKYRTKRYEWYNLASLNPYKEYDIDIFHTKNAVKCESPNAPPNVQNEMLAKSAAHKFGPDATVTNPKFDAKKMMMPGKFASFWAGLTGEDKPGKEGEPAPWTKSDYYCQQFDLMKAVARSGQKYDPEQLKYLDKKDHLVIDNIYRHHQTEVSEGKKFMATLKQLEQKDAGMKSLPQEPEKAAVKNLSFRL